MAEKKEQLGDAGRDIAQLGNKIRADIETLARGQPARQDAIAADGEVLHRLRNIADASGAVGAQDDPAVAPFDGRERPGRRGLRPRKAARELFSRRARESFHGPNLGADARRLVEGFPQRRERDVGKNVFKVLGEAGGVGAGRSSLNRLNWRVSCAVRHRAPSVGLSMDFSSTNARAGAPARASAMSGRPTPGFTYSGTTVRSGAPGNIGNRSTSSR